MTSSTPNGPELLRREILEEARLQKEEILRRARQEVEVIALKAESEAKQYHTERQEAAQAEAKRRTEAILATVPVEAGRMRSARIETLLQEIHDRAQERLRTRAGFDYWETIAHLSAGVLRQLAGVTFRLRVSVGEHRALADDLDEEIRRRSARPGVTLRLHPDANLVDGDARLEDEEGRQVWSLNLESRLERCWPELRQQIAARAGFTQQGSA